MGCSYRLSIRSLFLFVFSHGFLTAYTPPTWINGVPYNLHAPGCGMRQSQYASTGWKADACVHAVGLAQWGNAFCAQSETYGLALHGRLAMDRVLTGLYGQFYTSVLTNYEKCGNGIAQNDRHNGLTCISDSHAVLSYDVLNNGKIRLSGHLFGIIPAMQHALSDPKKKIYWVGLDNHMAWGLGFDSAVRLLGTDKHHVVFAPEADVTFLAGRRTTVWGVNQRGQGFEPYTIRIAPNRLYKVGASLVYRYHHFTGDIGVNYYHMTRLTDSVLKNIFEPATSWKTLFCDIGWASDWGKVQPYASVGVQRTFYEKSSHAFAVNCKFGIKF